MSVTTTKHSAADAAGNAAMLSAARVVAVATAMTASLLRTAPGLRPFCLRCARINAATVYLRFLRSEADLLPPLSGASCSRPPSFSLDQSWLSWPRGTSPQSGVPQEATAWPCGLQRGTVSRRGHGLSATWPRGVARYSWAPMSAEKSLHDRFVSQGEERIGRLAQELLENPMVNSALSAVFETRERAMRAQELAMAALNLPSASDLERLTRRLRNVSQRLEGIEDGLDRLEQRIDHLDGREVSDAGSPAIEKRIDTIEETLQRIESALAASKSAR